VSKKPVVKQPPSLTTFYDAYKAAASGSGAHYETARPGTKYDLGGGALLTVLAPSEPFFTKDHMRGGGNEPNANSIVVRLDYGSFSMLLAGDAEEQTEHRLLTKDLNLEARVLKVGHHGSKYASAADFLARVKPEFAIISCGAWNRYGHPSQAVLDRLRAAVPGLYVNGSLEHRLTNNLNVSFQGISGESLLVGIDDICVSAGSACSSGSEEPPYVLVALGLDPDLARASLRFGLGRTTTEAEIDYTSDKVASVVRQLRQVHSTR